MKRFQAAIFAVMVFSSGFTCGFLYNSPDSESRAAPITASNAGDVNPASDGSKASQQGQLELQSKLTHASEVISQLAFDNQALSQQIKQYGLSIESDTTESDLLNRLERLPDSLINQQLESLFDDEYLEGIDNKKAFAKKLVSVALTEVEDQSLSVEGDDNSHIDIRFSLSPITGLRQFRDISDLELNDTVFAHFTSTTAYPNLIVRWDEISTGEILRMGPLSLRDNTNGYLSLKPRNGWKPGDYRVSLFDIDNDQKIVGSDRYRVAHVIDNEDASSNVDQDVIDDLISNGMAVPKSH